MFRALARAIHHHRGRVFVASAVFLALALAALVRGGRLSTGVVEGTEAEQAQQLASATTVGSTDTTLAVVFHSDTLSSTSKEFQEALKGTLEAVAKLPTVEGVLSPLGAPKAVAAQLQASTGHDTLALVRLKGDIREATRAFPEVRAVLSAGPLQATLTGRIAFIDALNQLLEEDLLRAELISFPLALLVLLRVFRTWVASLLPLAVGGLAVLSGVAGVFVLSHFTDMAQYTINVVSLIGMGVAIDYSLFIVSRFRSELEREQNVEAALERTLDTAGRAVAFSGLAVAVGLAGLLFYRGSYLSAMGIGGALVVAFAVVFALTVLPALLSWLGPRVNRGRVPFPRLFADKEGLWHGLATWVMRHPVLVLVPTLLILVAVGLPFLRLQLAATDITALPAETEARRGAESLRQLFPRQAANGLVVVVQFPSGSAFTAERMGALYDKSRQLARIPGVIGIDSIVNLKETMDRDAYQELPDFPEDMLPPEFSQARDAYLHGSVTVMRVLTEAPASSQAARDIVEAVRKERAVGDGKLLVAGQTASDVDAGHFVRAHTPWAIGFVMGLMCLVLFVLLGSVVLPLKAMLMNLLSIAGSFGALVWIFQEGHLSGLLNFEPGPIEPSLPVLLFCALFGLSMDYEVLLLSRMREEWERTHDNAHSVAEGLERTGGLITSAAAIMVAVFAAFSLAHVVVVKAMGVGMAIAVALDATLVRILLVPAMMRLFGDFNWWAPKALARWLSLAHQAHGPSERPPR
ncbi:MMPL family transporter [Stigmatella sp. ncwal1]|uniref:MMPL family transporter n=1 Tax=Stigmatella ashevillensis TaxID=2995309 RepID=A0ABT5D6U7_9BACT|nr:MMPL family transporter [Stigmatella ashevillena]MDC0708789.1 MMPL family transporter [Stigmatella ashevillena]